jgi:hypothetical protein
MTDDALGLTDGLGRDNIPGSLFEPVEAALISAHAQIMRGRGHWSNC